MFSFSTRRWPSSCAFLPVPGEPVRYMSALADPAPPGTRGQARTGIALGAFITPRRTRSITWPVAARSAGARAR